MNLVNNPNVTTCRNCINFANKHKLWTKCEHCKILFVDSRPEWICSVGCRKQLGEMDSYDSHEA